MSWPPFSLKLRFENKDHSFGLWLPLFIIGPVVLLFLLAVFIILLPFALLSFLFTWETGWLESWALGIPALLRLFVNLRGLKVDVDSPEGVVYIAFD
jgi:hypothetical protein